MCSLRSTPYWRCCTERSIENGSREPLHATAVDLDAGQRLLDAHTRALLGAVPPERGVAIMVTMPSEAADDYSLVQHLVEHGMDCMRINCAHDDEAAWARMIDHLRRAELATGRKCRVLMDLAGPKLRTGPLEPGPAVVKVRPTRDAFGRVTQPARIWFSSQETPRKPPTPADASLELPTYFSRRSGRRPPRVHRCPRGQTRDRSRGRGRRRLLGRVDADLLFHRDMLVRAQREGADIGDARRRHPACRRLDAAGHRRLAHPDSRTDTGPGGRSR